MTWSRHTSGWRDGECLSAAILAGGAALAAAATWLPAGYAPRCLLKALTGVPCLTCGGYRALSSLRAGYVGRAFALQPLLTLVAFLVAAWVAYALAGALLRLPRIRAHATRREKRLLAAGTVAAVLANWAYLIAAGV